ncbi:MAG TPA: NAD(P)/FAD-dependent oxidoreductase [Balneolales bacterium]|nr:NAD(P)/FAD-dependent oxidoreductase [Balneolales bacterium]
MDKRKFDLIVIGTGSGASTAAGKCVRAGWSVAQIDERPFGGTCALRGCDPKKVLIGAAELMDWNHRMKGHGFRTNPSIDWKELMKYKQSFTDPVPEAREKGIRNLGITPFHGQAQFVDKASVKVGDQILTGKFILIATGAKPAPLPIEGAEHLTDSTGFLDLEELPGHIVFVGGGYISFEFAFISALAGAEVSIVHRGKRPLEGFDEDLVRVLLKKANQLGIKIYLNAEVRSIEVKSGRYTVTAHQKDQSISIDGDLVIHGAGRIPNIDNLKLEKAGTHYEKRGISVNDYLQSVSNPQIYAAGDVAFTNGKPLTPIAGYESNIVASNLLDGNHRKAEYPAQPTVVFTIPPMASVGLTQKEAEEKGRDVKVSFGNIESWYSYKRINEPHAAYKTILEKETGKILGAHLLGTKSEEIINLFAMAINHGLTSTDFKKMIYAYPSHSSDIPYMVVG